MTRASDVMNAKAPAPGANDDASGTAAVMAVACSMARHKFDATLVFMAVAGEEQGLLGAAHWAQRARERNLNVAGMFTNDIIGSSRSEHGAIDDKQVRLFAEGIPALKEMSDSLRTLIATGGESDSLSRQLARHVKEMGERYVPGFTVSIVHRRDRYLRGGDHLPFLDRGYAALRFTEPNEDFNHQHQDVRMEKGVQIGDLPEFVDFEYTANVARVNAAALATLALAPAAPSNVQMKTTQLKTIPTWSGAPIVNRAWPVTASSGATPRPVSGRAAPMSATLPRLRSRASPRTTISLACRRWTTTGMRAWPLIRCPHASAEQRSGWVESAAVCGAPYPPICNKRMLTGRPSFAALQSLASPCRCRPACWHSSTRQGSRSGKRSRCPCCRGTRSTPAP